MQLKNQVLEIHLRRNVSVEPLFEEGSEFELRRESIPFFGS